MGRDIHIHMYIVYTYTYTYFVCFYCYSSVGNEPIRSSSALLVIIAVKTSLQLDKLIAQVLAQESLALRSKK